MFELCEILQNGDMRRRVYPIVLDDARIFKAIDIVRYVKHWETQIAELDAALKGVGADNLQGVHDDADLYRQIRTTIAEITNTLRDMNALTPDKHRKSGFSDLFEAIIRGLVQ